MGDDKLTRAERIRLEAFAQAVNSAAAVRLAGPDRNPEPVFVSLGDQERRLFAALLDRAEAIEAWLYKAETPQLRAERARRQP